MNALLKEINVGSTSWWTPERPYAIRNINTGEIVPDAVQRGSSLIYQGVTLDAFGNLVVADLTNVPRSQIYGA